MRKRQSALKQANRRLPKTLTDDFVSDLSSVLKQDGSVKARYLEAYWLSKYADIDPTSSINRREAAITKWLSVEERNRITNRNLSTPEYERTHALWGVGITLKEVLDGAAAIS